MRGLLTFLALSTSLLCGLAQALEFKSVGANPVILYDAPTLKGGKVYVAPRGMPVELILTYGAWSKVRDMAGDLSWVESKDLVARRNVIVRVSNAKVRAAADETAAMVFSADKNVLLEMAEPVAGAWIKVKHKDGQLGYVKASEVWGN
ncbi:SH3 domain-containing protein [Undibacterium sp.]|uniref:SH3 domain-containing protein n=1 Tax=Undibacterium sp. TaxID=1914977 RepID=UPI0025D3CABD|nr:SH3 domain-containing protein [Undibacterium sp.]MCX7220006.1 SH3 domain-containing protein [Burkholderiales bacterium]